MFLYSKRFKILQYQKSGCLACLQVCCLVNFYFSSKWHPYRHFFNFTCFNMKDQPLQVHFKCGCLKGLQIQHKMVRMYIGFWWPKHLFFWNLVSLNCLYFQNKKSIQQLLHPDGINCCWWSSTLEYETQQISKHQVMVF